MVAFNLEKKSISKETEVLKSVKYCHIKEDEGCKLTTEFSNIEDFAGLISKMLS